MSSPLRGYAICTEQRSGSSYLCQVLASTGVLGRPLEYFNGPGMAVFQPGYPQDAEGQLREILRQGATENGVYGVKLFSANFDRLARSRWVEKLPNLLFISLTRRDLLGQAISVVRLAQTNQYSADASALREPYYDRPSIAHAIHSLAWGQARWAAFFARCGIAPLYLDYDETAAHPQAAADRIARLLGLDAPSPVDPQQVYTRIQRDALSDRWRARFLSETRDLGFLDRPLPPSFAASVYRKVGRKLRRVSLKWRP